MSNLTECPYCGSKNGYLTKQTRTVTRQYSWSGRDSEDCDDLEVIREGAPRCQDCGKPVRAALANRENK